MEDSSFQRARNNIEKGVMTEGAEKLSQEHLDLLRCYNEVFSTENGKKIIEDLDKVSHHRFPQWESVNYTYSKIGEQELVKYIKAMLRISKGKK